MTDTERLVDIVEKWCQSCSFIDTKELAYRIIKAGFRKMPSDIALREVIYDETPSILDKAQQVRDMMWAQK